MAKKTKKATHGGYRPGAGRKPKYSESTIKRAVLVPQSLSDWADSQEGKTFSDFVVESLEAARKRAERKPKKKSQPPKPRSD